MFFFFNFPPPSLRIASRAGWLGVWVFFPCMEGWVGLVGRDWTGLECISEKTCFVDFFCVSCADTPTLFCRFVVYSCNYSEYTKERMVGKKEGVCIAFLEVRVGCGWARAWGCVV